MKSKKLIIVVLVLAIVTTLSAGTLAIYTTRLETIADTNVTAKQFILKGETAKTEEFTFRLAPGESMTSGDITISNHDSSGVTEVNMDMRIAPTGNTANLRSFFNTMPSATIELLQQGVDGPIATWTAADLNELVNNGKNCDISNLFIANTAKDAIFNLRVTWVDDGNAAYQTGLAERQANCSFALYMKGTQHVDAAVETPVEPAA